MLINPYLIFSSTLYLLCNKFKLSFFLYNNKHFVLSINSEKLHVNYAHQFRITGIVTKIKLDKVYYKLDRSICVDPSSLHET